MSATDTRYGRRGGRWLPKGHNPVTWREDLARIRAAAGDGWPDLHKIEAAQLGDIDWSGRARMARARWAAGVALDDVDRQALRRHPA